MANALSSFDPVGSFQTARSNALTIAGQEADAALQPQRNELASLNLQKAKQGLQAGQLSSDQQRAATASRFIVNSNQALLQIPLEQRAAALQSLVPQAQQAGIDVGSLDLSQPLTDDVLNNAIQSASTIIQTLQGGTGEPVATAGLASAKTEIYEDGTIINALPDGTSQVINPSGQVVEGQARIDVLRAAKESGLAQLQAESDIAVEEARLKADATNRASRISTITSEMNERNRTAKRGEINLAQAAILVEQAAQGVEGVNKVRLARLFPGIDVSNEAALSQSLTNLALDELQKFSGPTTDFEFQKTEEIAGTLGDSQTANRAKIASLQRANWFNQREAKQFQEHAKSGGDPDTFGFNFGEPVKTKKGVFTLRDIQDTAVANNISIDDALKRLNQ